MRCGASPLSGTLIVMLDADGSADPAEISQLSVAALEVGADFGQGIRFLAGGGSTDITPYGARQPLPLCNVNVLYRTRFTDSATAQRVLGPLPAVISLDAPGFEVRRDQPADRRERAWDLRVPSHEPSDSPAGPT